MKQNGYGMLLLVMLFFPLHAALAGEQQPRLITVAGEAEVMVVPDKALLTLGVETRNRNLEAAKSDNDQRIRKIINAAQKIGIEPKHIQTDYMNIEPQYEYKPEGGQVFSCYVVKKSMVLTVLDTTKLEGLLGAVLEAGANYIDGVQFSTTKLRKHKDQARTLAAKAAREKAEALAQELGQKVGRPYTIDEVFSGWQPWNAGGVLMAKRNGGMAGNMTFEASDSGQSQNSIALGQIKVSAQIRVSFELE